MKHRGDLIACAGLTAAWAIPLLVVGLHGEFPVSDDWAYAQVTQGLLETGRFERPAWTWAPILSNVAIGTAVSWLFGFSFEALRASSYVLGWIGTLGVYALCRQLGIGQRLSTAGAALYGWNPIHLALSFTFMTDVAFAAFCTWGLVALARGLRDVHPGWIAVGGVLALAAILSRQPGLALPVGAALAGVVSYVRRPRTLGLMAAAVFIAAAILSFAPSLIYGAGDAGKMFTFRVYVREFLLGPYVHFFAALNAVNATAYLGAFLAPAALLALPRGRRMLPYLAAGVVCSALVILGVVELRRPLPPGIDWISDFSLGPIALSGDRKRPALGPVWWWPIVALGSFAGGLALVAMLRALRGSWAEPRQRAQTLLLLAFPVVYLAVLAVRQPFFDRYYIPILPPLIALVLRSPSHRPGLPALLASGVAAIALTAYGLLGTRDLMEHHRTRSALLAELVAAGVSPRAIDGGNEFGGWHNSRFWKNRRFLRRPHRFWVVGDEYVLGFRDRLPNYHRVASRSYRRLLPPPGVETLTVLHREGSADDPHVAENRDQKAEQSSTLRDSAELR